MKKTFEFIQATRNNFYRVLDVVSINKIQEIPEGYNNNIYWNFGHVIVTQQLLTYGRSGLEFKVNKEIIESFRKGTSLG